VILSEISGTQVVSILLRELEKTVAPGVLLATEEGRVTVQLRVAESDSLDEEDFSVVFLVDECRMGTEAS